ncbi:hypothetical protein [Methylobacterium oryzihabitans]|uniref:Uncharacterized protein n=1 Tax=Methylobacterium oryzihabitans TaxID=2499852 RepID=A0A437NR49_9HYPH|nr:hypothetical protein [Methylobacterium oryzihabitans]RVU12533.1 hypothetical protein EOE48_27715 [Methylobacterium oryzihabitans]
MRTRLVAAAAFAALVGIPSAFAQDVTVIRRDAPEAERTTTIERRSVESTGSVGGCESKTVKKTNEFGDTKTVRSERCD